MKRKMLIVLLSLLSFVSCNKNSDTESVKVTTFEMRYIAPTSINILGRVDVLVEGDFSFKPGSREWGVCYGSQPNPTKEDNFVSNQNAYSSFNVDLINLTPSAKYYARVFYSSYYGVYYGLDCMFTTPEAGIGEHKEGGIVFWIDPNDSNHGLVCSIYDYGADWGTTGLMVGATDTTFGSGQQNTNLIIQNDPNLNSAASLCDGLVMEGFNDWYLPSLDELKIIYAYRALINLSIEEITGSTSDFLSSGNWSSSEIDNDMAWYYDFNDNLVSSGYKGNGYYVRAIRAY